MFFTDARCPKENVVGGVNNGWAVAMTLLGYERGEAAATFPIMFRAELDRLLAPGRGDAAATDDPIIRQRLAWCHTKVEIMRYLGMRTLTKFLHGRAPRPRRVDLQALLERVPPGRHRAGGRHPRRPTPWSPSGRWPSNAFQTDDAGAPERQRVVGRARFLIARAGTIYAGTSQVQRNIIGEMVLGLPKEPRLDPGHLARAPAGRQA